MKCPKCGAEAKDGTRFCQYCGHSLENANTSSYKDAMDVNNRDEDVLNKDSKPRSKKTKIIMAAVAAIAVFGGIKGYQYLTRFDSISEYNSLGIAAVSKNGKCGYVDENKKIVIPVQYQSISWGDATSYGLTFIKADQDIYVMGEDGELAYDSCEETQYFPWYKVQSGEKYGLISTEGKEIVPCDYKELEVGTANEESIGIKLNGEENFISKAGEILYDKVGEENAYGWLQVYKDGKTGYVDKIGNVLLPTQYQSIEIGEKQADGYTPVRADDSCNFVDMNGKLKYKEVHSFAANGLAAACNDYYKWGYINHQGDEVIPFDYVEVEDFQSNGMAKVKLFITYGCIDETGNLVIPCEYTEMSDFSGEIALAKKGTLGMFINTDGQIISDYLSQFTEEGVAYTRIQGKYCFVDQKGTMVNDASYDYVEKLEGTWTDDDKTVEFGAFKVRNGAKYGLVDYEGKEIAEPAYDVIITDMDKYSIWKDGQQGLMDLSGEILCEPIYEEIYTNNETWNLFVAKTTDGVCEIRNQKGKVIAQHEAEKAAIYGDEGEEIAVLDVADYASVYDWTGKLLSEHDVNYAEIRDARKEGMKLGEKKGDDLLYGVVDYKGNVIADKKLWRLYMCKEGVIYNQDGQAGVIDYEGNVINSNSYEYIEGNHLENSLISVKVDGKFGYANKTKNFEIEIPCQYDGVWPFYTPDRAVVILDNKYGLIDASGQYIVEPVYDLIDKMYNYDGNKGDSEDYYIIIDHDKHGIIDKQGNVCTKPEYDEVYDYGEYVCVKNLEKWGVVKRATNEIVVPIEYEYIDFYVDYGVIWAYSEDEVVYYNIDGMKMFSSGWASGISEDGLITVREEGDYKISDTYGDNINYVWDASYMSKFYYGRARVEKNGFCGFYDENGINIIPYIYDDAGNYESEGMAPVCKDEKWGLIDTIGNQIVECIYDEIGDFSCGFAPVKKGEKWGFINTEGKEVVETKYDDYTPFYSEHTRVSINDGDDEKEYRINYKGEVLEEVA